MSIHNTITEFPRPSNQQKRTTLDEVVKAIENWRVTKKTRQEPIPEIIWDQIFSLRNQFAESTLRTTLGISSAQYRQKLQERAPPSTPTPSAVEPPSIDFCEVKTAPPYKPVKVPATNTLIVEFCRADGRIMKIHTTTDSFSELMKAFFAGD